VTRGFTGLLRLAPEVERALIRSQPVVALETSLVAHGLPHPDGLEVALRCEDRVREAGVVPATIAVVDGAVRVGLDEEELERLSVTRTARKVGPRDLASAVVSGGLGATTVAGALAVCRIAGIHFMATGGLGGVHRGAADTFDVSADLDVLAETPIVVVCSGVKSILDIGATLEVLETRSIPVLGYRTATFPAFYLRESAYPAPWTVRTPAEAAAVARAHFGSVPGTAGIVLANPVPREAEMPRGLHDELLAGGLARLAERGITGHDVTPALLEHFHAASGGVSIDTNEELVVANAALAAEVAVALAA